MDGSRDTAWTPGEAPDVEFDPTPTVGILAFEGAEELDVVGPYEVFAYATRKAPGPRVHLLAATTEPIACAKALRLVPDRALEDAPALDVLVVPGGRGVRRELENEALLAWIRDTAATTPWVTSVCTGSGLLVASGVAAGRRVATHHTWSEELRAIVGPDGRGAAEVVEGERFVRDGHVLTSAGVSSGIDMALWLVEELQGAETARAVRRSMEYGGEPLLAPR